MDYMYAYILTNYLNAQHEMVLAEALNLISSDSRKPEPNFLLLHEEFVCNC